MAYNYAEEKDDKNTELDADHLKEGTISGIISELNNKFMQVESSVGKLVYATSYGTALDAIKSAQTLAATGPHVDFCRKNKWLGDKGQRNSYLTKCEWKAGEEDKRLVCQFYDLMNASAHMRSKFAELMSLCESEFILYAEKAIIFEENLSQRISFDTLYDIRLSFAEFDNVYNTFNNSSIYSKIPVSKESPYEENLETVLDYLDDALCEKPHLSKFLLNTRTTAASGINQLYSIDRTTAQFKEIASREDTMKRAQERISDLLGEIDDLNLRVTNDTRAYLDGYRNVLYKLSDVFTKAIKSIRNFQEKKDELPYSVMHYDALVKDCVSKHMLGSLSDPMTKGTNYNTIAESMLNKCRQLAKTVAKLAP